MSENQTKKTEQILFMILTGAFLIGLMLVCSLATSPLYPHNFSQDSAFFRFIGKEILSGKTPYTDVWDNKGPLLYFLQALGAWKGTTNKGSNVLFLLQLISLFLSVFFMYKTYRLISHGKGTGLRFFILTACTLAVFSLTIESGNLTEEWCLPMICCSLYLLCAYAQRASSAPAHPKAFAFWHGICFGMIAMIRINNAIPVCAGLLSVGIYLILKKQWKNLLVNICFGLLGILCVLLPICFWFYARGALYDMIYSVFLYNLKYIRLRSFVHYRGEPFVTRYLPIAEAILLMIIHFIRVRRKISLTDMICSSVLIVSAIMLIKSNVYLHYFTVFIPVLYLVLIRCADRIRIPEAVILIILCAWFGFRNVQRLPDLLSLHRQRQMFTAAERIPEGERNSVIAVNMPPEIYLNYGLEPVSRYCAYQHVHFGIDPAMKQEFLKTLTDKPPLWILAFCSGETNIPEVQQRIDEAYQLQFDESDVCYYRLP